MIWSFICLCLYFVGLSYNIWLSDRQVTILTKAYVANVADDDLLYETVIGTKDPLCWDFSCEYNCIFVKEKLYFITYFVD